MLAIKITKAAECLAELVEQTNNKSAPISLMSVPVVRGLRRVQGFYKIYAFKPEENRLIQKKA